MSSECIKIMTPMQKMQLVSKDVAGDLQVLRSKAFSWRYIADVYGVTHDEIKEVAHQLGMAKRGSQAMVAKVSKPVRCTHAQAKVIADKVGISTKTVLDRAYRMPHLTLDEIQEYSIAAKGRRRAAVTTREQM